MIAERDDVPLTRAVLTYLFYLTHHRIRLSCSAATA